MIFVNDSFSLSHKILASTVGITCFCYASLAGFHFEEELMKLIKITDSTRRPYIAIVIINLFFPDLYFQYSINVCKIGGSNFLRKAPALQTLTCLCDGLFFVGKLSFQIMNGFGMTVPSQFIERNAVKEVLQIIQVARDRNIPIYYPTDLWCLKNGDSEISGVINSTGQLAGWTPADIGPSTLEKISSIITSYKKILWIGPTNYGLTEKNSVGGTQLGEILESASSDGCDVILVGDAACKAVKRKTDSSPQYTEFQKSTVVWEFLKGRILPGIAALDKGKGGNRDKGGEGGNYGHGSRALGQGAPNHDQGRGTAIAPSAGWPSFYNPMQAPLPSTSNRLGGSTSSSVATSVVLCPRCFRPAKASD
ncbi:Phosphoglycerate kinase [Zea mays]|uniref:phosphoglycerate kinase n=1 Tax=Zea mays TaxID=4577 RepID=A0A1D6KUK3_MAIZE|nr:Phosphoglycerate kinase [Zea mays]